MDIFIMRRVGDLWFPETLYDRHISMTWADRFNELGDFELVTTNDRESRELFANKTVLSIPMSRTLMIVDTIEENRSDGGESTLTVKGRSYDVMFASRVAVSLGSLSGLDTAEKWILTGTPQDIMNSMVNHIVITGTVSTSDILSELNPWIPSSSGGDTFESTFESTFGGSGTGNNPGDIPFPTETITVEVEPTDLLGAISNLATLYNLGFRIWLDRDTHELSFYIYSGVDRTSGQSIVPSVVFGESQDTLSNVNSIMSTASYKSVALVLAKKDSSWVYADNLDPFTTGFDRKVIVVAASDLDADPGPGLNASMLQKGKEALGANRPIIGFDGEIANKNPYVYNVDYGLGDLVEIRDSNGNINNMRVTEQIFISDAEGERSYPTLTFDMLITPGTWLARPISQNWIDATGQWIEQ